MVVKSAGLLVEKKLPPVIEHLGNIGRKEFLELIDDQRECARRPAICILLASLANLPDFFEKKRSDEVRILLIQKL